MPSTNDDQAGEPVVLDVRPIIAAGAEPFSTIMAAVDTLDGRVLELHSPFEPVPLHGALARRGLRHSVTRVADDHWITRYEALPEGGGPASPAAGTGADSADAPADVPRLDVRGLAPPEPMVRTLAALDELPIGATLVQVNERVPVFLLAELDERGWPYRIEERDDMVVTHITRGPS